MDDDLDPAYDHETAIADLTRVSEWIAATPDRDGPYINREDCMGAAADLNQALAWIKRNAPKED